MDPVATFSTSPPFTITPPFNTTTADGVGYDDIDVGPAGRDFSEEEKTPSAPSEAGTTKRGRGRGRGNTSLEKRPRVMGMGVFQAANGFKIMNPGMPSTKIYSTGQAKVTRSSDAAGDIGYTPSNTTKLKWNGKAAISTSKLHELREKQRKKTMGNSSNNSSRNDTFSQSKMPWKL
ncbi:hypothetical protein KY285_026315 [Solanum tuberosum]|nr:hypothetical protein KY285_026315 [Solanum tuberosum]